MSDYPQVARFINFLRFLSIKGIIKISNTRIQLPPEHDQEREKNEKIYLENFVV